MKRLSLFYLLFCTNFLYAQNVGIGTGTPHPKAILHLEDNTRGFLFTRMTTAERDTMTNIPEGLTIYNLTTHCLDIWNGTKWLSWCDNAGTACNAFQCSTPNTWNSLATPPSTISLRNNQIAIAYNGKIYMGFGDISGTYYKDWWEYDVCNKTWTQLANFPGAARTLPFVFELNGKIYVGGGQNFSGAYYADVYAFDPSTNSWSAKAALPSGRGGAPGTADGKYGFVFGGKSSSGYLDEVLRYDPVADAWSVIANYPAGGRWIGIISVVGTNLYMGTGHNASGVVTADFYQYDLNTNTWNVLASHPFATYDSWAIYVPTNNRIYVLGGHTSSGCTNQFYAYDVAANSWNAIAPFTGGNRNNLIGAYWDGVIYAGFGHNCSSYFRDWWAYCP